MIERKKVHSNLIQQDCYVNYVVAPYDEKKDYHVDKYVALDFVQEASGLREIFHEEPYPITPEYVKSFVDSCDYKLNPFEPRPPVGKNFGDVREIQSLNSRDSADVISAVAHVNSAMERGISSVKKKESEVVNNG